MACLISLAWLPAKCPKIPTTDFNFGEFLTWSNDLFCVKSFNPTDKTLVITVLGKQLPTWATTQSKFGECFTDVSKNGFWLKYA